MLQQAEAALRRPSFFSRLFGGEANYDEAVQLYQQCAQVIGSSYSYPAAAVAAAVAAGAAAADAAGAADAADAVDADAAATVPAAVAAAAVAAAFPPCIYINK